MNDGVGVPAVADVADVAGATDEGCAAGVVVVADVVDEPHI